ncbi:Peroxyureidoacrylate_ureidoacrylate amidohydrolase RutB [Streptomyces sp. enrichment culture]|uniref:cysteine hydrolase family protein n=1 Tax=Streptomyces sp. enrichment culture TaxID=1795815 RepID=UPI003F579493
MKPLRSAVALCSAALLAATVAACGGSSQAVSPKSEPSAPATGTNAAEDTTTLRELNGFDETPARLSDAALILVDYQNTYTEGVMELDGWRPAVDNAVDLLARAREAGTPVIHIVDKGYDLKSKAGRIIPALEPAEGEPVVEKSVPDAFHGTGLAEQVEKTGRKKVIVAGFMTNMCVLFTTQGAFLGGYEPTVVADASATRPLPLKGDPNGIPAEQVHEAALATVQDLYGVVVPSQKSLA